MQKKSPKSLPISQILSLVHSLAIMRRVVFWVSNDRAFIQILEGDNGSRRLYSPCLVKMGFSYSEDSYTHTIKVKDELQD